jgi:hypothetical protein
MSKKKKKDDNSDELKSDRIILQKIKEKSEDDFEKNITYISAGALAISLTFLEKIVPIKESVQTYLVIASWTLLVITLLSNLLSHQYSSYIIDKTIDDVDDNSEDSVKNWERRTKKIRAWNILNVCGVIIGIGLFIIFVSINISKMAKDTTPENTRTNTTTEQTGLTPVKSSLKVIPTNSTKFDSTKTNIKTQK